MVRSGLPEQHRARIGWYFGPELESVGVALLSVFESVDVNGGGARGS
jgi:hypothetical protein